MEWNTRTFDGTKSFHRNTKGENQTYSVFWIIRNKHANYSTSSFSEDRKNQVLGLIYTAKLRSIFTK